MSETEANLLEEALNSVKEAANKDHAPWYSLAGDRAPNPHKGIYVKKGRKVIFK